MANVPIRFSPLRCREDLDADKRNIEKLVDQNKELIKQKRILVRMCIKRNKRISELEELNKVLAFAEVHVIKPRRVWPYETSLRPPEYPQNK